MNYIVTLLSLLLMTLIGFSLIKFMNVFEKRSDYEMLPYAFGLGAGISSLQLYLYSRLGVPWQLGLVAAPLVIVVLACLVRGKIALTKPKIMGKNSFIEKLLIAAICILIIYVALESVMRPVTAWDGWSSWLLRAKMFFIEKGVAPATFAYIPSEYPVVVSLMSTFLYLLIGKVDDRSALLLYPAFYIALGLLFYNSLTSLTGKKIALLFTFLTLSIQNVIRHSGRFEAGQADIILGFYAFASLMLFSLYSKAKNIKTLILLQMFLIITSLIKDDGISLVLFIQVMLLFLILKRRSYAHLLLFMMWLLPFMEWQLFKAKLALPSTPSYIGNAIHVERIPLIVAEFAKEFLNIGNWNLVWVAFIISVAIYITAFRRNFRYFPYYGIVIFQICVYAGVFLFTSPDPHQHIPNVINRAFLHVVPIAMFAVAANTAIIKGKLKNDKV